jgi:hypothetical protein
MQVTSRGTLVAIAALALAGAPLAAQEAATPDQQEACRLALEPASIQVQADAFNVEALLERDLGEELTASVAEESGLQVAIVPLQVEPAAEISRAVAEEEAEAAGEAQENEEAEAEENEEAEAEAQESPELAVAGAAAEFEAKQIISLKLDASAAQPGEYEIQVSSGDAQCSGKVTVTAPAEQ